jgi:hypothetical protein
MDQTISAVVRNELYVYAPDPATALLVARENWAEIEPLTLARIALNAAGHQSNSSAGRHLMVALLKVAQQALRRVQ